jgi:hypothetical protein
MINMESDWREQIYPNFQILYQLSDSVAWRWQAPISLVIHRFLNFPAQTWTPQEKKRSQNQIKDREVSEEVIGFCLRFLYNLPAEEFQPHQAAIFHHLYPRFRVLPSVRSLQQGLMQYQKFLIHLCEDFNHIESFCGNVWTHLILRLRKRGDPRVQALKVPQDPSREDMFTYVVGCRHHGIEYRKRFPDSPPIPEDGDRCAGQFKTYIDACGLDRNEEHITRKALKIGRKLLAIEEALECPGISLVMILIIRELDQMKALEIHKLIALLSFFQQFPKIVKLGRVLSPEMRTYQNRFGREVALHIAAAQPSHISTDNK